MKSIFEMSKKYDLTIAIVYYKNLNESHFKLSLSAALTQIGIGKYNVNVYLDNTKLNLEDDRFKIIQLPKSLAEKPAKIREYIVNDISTKYIAFWDSDDIYTIDRMYKQINCLINNKLDLCFSNFLFFNETEIFKKDFFSLIGLNERTINIFDENYMGFGILAADVSYLKSLMPFPDIRVLDWWIGIKSKLLSAKIICLPDILGYYRIYPHSQSKKFNNIEVEDFIKEKQIKIELYSLFPNVKELCLRKKFIEAVDVRTDFQELKNNYLNLKYKNILGGLIKYENN
jgi:hypothetical protein